MNDVMTGVIAGIVFILIMQLIAYCRNKPCKCQFCKAEHEEQAKQDFEDRYNW